MHRGNKWSMRLPRVEEASGKPEGKTCGTSGTCEQPSTASPPDSPDSHSRGWGDHPRSTSPPGRSVIHTGEPAGSHDAGTGPIGMTSVTGKEPWSDRYAFTCSEVFVSSSTSNRWGAGGPESHGISFSTCCFGMAVKYRDRPSTRRSGPMPRGPPIRVRSRWPFTCCVEYWQKRENHRIRTVRRSVSSHRNSAIHWSRATSGLIVTSSRS